METLKILGWPLAFIIAALFLIPNKCNHTGVAGNTVIHDTVTIPGDKKLVTAQDTHQLKPVKEYVPHWLYDTIHDTVPGRIDTALIIRNYFTSYILSDTFRKDQVLGVIWDSLSQNRIFRRIVMVQNLRPIQVAQTIVQPQPAIRLYAGFRIGASTPFKPIVEANLILATKRDQLLQLGYDPINKSYLLGMAWKLHF